MKHNRSKRVFVGPQPSTPAQRDEVIAHIKSIAEQALAIALDLYRQEGKLPAPDDMLIFIVSAMVSLEVDKPIADIIQFCMKYGEQIRTMSTFLWYLFDHEGLQIPDGFPYTVEQFKAVA